MKPSLNQLRILNTRPKKQAAALSQDIRALGGVAIECPTLDIQPISAHWLEEMPDLNKVDHLIFTSPNAVEHSISLLKKNNIPLPARIQITAIGKGTAKALSKHHLKVDHQASLPTSEGLLSLPSLSQSKGKHFLLFKGEGGRDLIQTTLMHAGAWIKTISVYKRVKPTLSQEFIDSLWREDAVDIILFTSEQSMRNLFELFGTQAQTWLQNKPGLVISDRLAQIAIKFGIKKIIIAHPERMLDALFE